MILSKKVSVSDLNPSRINLLLQSAESTKLTLDFSYTICKWVRSNLVSNMQQWITEFEEFIHSFRRWNAILMLKPLQPIGSTISIQESQVTTRHYHFQQN